MNIFDIINVPLGYLIKFCYMIVPNYAIALLLFAIIIKVILFPLGIKQQKNSVKQASLKPKEMAIRARYAGRTDKATQQKVQEEVMKLYQQENFNPMGGCLPMLIELPVIFALYGVVNNPLRYLCGLSVEVIEGITNVITQLELVAANTTTTQIQMIHIMKSNFDAFVPVLPPDFGLSSLPNFNVIGSAMDLSLTPSFSEPSLLLIIPILVFVSQFASTKLIRKFSYTPAQSGDAGASMKIMEFTMPLMGVFFSFSMPSVIGLYWIYQSLISIVRQIVLAKMFPYPQFTEEDYKAAEREMNGKISKKERKRLNAENPNKVRSLHRIDDETDDEETDDENDNENEDTPQAEEDNGLIGRAALKEDKKPNNKKEK